MKNYFKNYLKKQSFSLIYKKEDKSVTIVGGYNYNRKICTEVIEYNFERNQSAFTKNTLPCSASFIQGEFFQLFDGNSYTFTENFGVLKFNPATKQFTKIDELIFNLIDNSKRKNISKSLPKDIFYSFQI